jgi:hypothetical protein
MEKSKALKTRLQAAINAQKLRINEAEDYINFLKGKQYPKVPKKDEVTFNICHTTVQAILNSILRGKPYIYVEPLSPEAVGLSPIVEKVVNWWWEKIKVKYQLELSIIDYAALGFGVTYSDWDFEQNEYGMIINDEPLVRHIPFKDFLIDPKFTVEEIYQCDYMIRKFIRPTKEIKKDSRYKHTKNLKGDVSLSKEIYKDVSDDIEQTTLYQIWIPDDEASYIMVEGSDDILREVENKFGREYPFTIMQNYKMPSEQFPFGEVKILYESQKLINRLYSLVITHAKRVATRQFTYNDLIKIEEVRKLRNAEDGEIFKVEGNAKPTDAIAPIPDAPLSSDIYKAIELLGSMVVQLTSISEYRRSIMPKDQRKATEAVYIEQGTEMSTSSKAEDVAEHCENIAKKIFKLLTHEQNINTRQITYKDEKTGQYVTQEYNNASFPGEYSFRWESGVAAPINAATRQQKITSFLSVLGTIAASNPNILQRINWQELLQSIATDFEIKNIEQILTPEQPVQSGQVLTPEQPVQSGQEITQGGY